MVKVRRGDVYWVVIEGMRRPAAVLTRDSAISLLRRIVVVPATRTIRGAPSEVRLGSSDGMPSDCVLTLDNLQVVNKTDLGARITTLSPSRLDEVCERIGYALGC